MIMAPKNQKSDLLRIIFLTKKEIWSCGGSVIPEDLSGCIIHSLDISFSAFITDAFFEKDERKSRHCC